MEPLVRAFDPVSLRLFVAVCETRNIAAAAKREAIVASALSKRISQMEQQAGVGLLSYWKGDLPPLSAWGRNDRILFKFRWSF